MLLGIRVSENLISAISIVFKMMPLPNNKKNKLTIIIKFNFYMLLYFKGKGALIYESNLWLGTDIPAPSRPVILSCSSVSCISDPLTS